MVKLKVEFFPPLTVGQLDPIPPYISLYGYDAGEVVFRQGQAGDAFYIVHAGKVIVQLRKNLVFQKTVATLGPGSFFGEIALVSRSPRTALTPRREIMHNDSQDRKRRKERIKWPRALS